MNDLQLPRWKKVVFSLILAVVMLGIFELAAQVGLKMTRGYDGEHLLQYEFDPYKNILPTRNFVDTRGIQHNAQGFRRSSPVERVKPEGTYRIFLMGASTAYGLGGLWSHIQREYAVLDNSETIDAYLERMLSERFPGQRFEVINAAITSTWTHHNLIYLNQTILGYDPDMILFLDGYNDFYHFERGHDQFASYTYNLTSTRIMGDPTLRSLVAMNGWWLYRKSALAYVGSRVLRNVKLVVQGRPEQRPLDPDSAYAGFVDAFPRNALSMVERIGLITSHAGVRPVFMLQPMLILERDRAGAPEIEQQLFQFNVDSYRPGYEQYITRAVEHVRAIEPGVVEAVGGTFIDMTRIYDGVAEQIYTDYAHLTPRGNEILAEVALERIAPMIAADLARAP